MTRSRRVEKAIKENDKEFLAIGKNYEGFPVTEFTNEGSDGFCPFIDNKRLAKNILAGHGEGDVHRDYPARFLGVVDMEKVNPKNRTYHFIQLRNWVSVQYCKYQKDGEKNYEKCEYAFKNCAIYKEHIQEV